MSEPASDVGAVDVPPFWVWLGAQHLNQDPERAEAAKHLRGRWGFWEGYSHAKALRALTRENSEYERGARMLADDYVTLFGVAPKMQVVAFGALTPLVPVRIDQCTHMYNVRQCSRDAIPGSDKCARHGGSWITEEERKAIVAGTTQRLTLVADRAVSVLIDSLDNAKSEKVRTDVAFGILDRIGVGPSAKIDLSVSSGADEAAAALRANLERLAARLVQQGEPEVIDVVEAVVVDDGDDSS